MASQRHKLWEQGATAAGEIHAQGVVAPGIAMQVDPEALNVLKAGPPLYNTGLELKEPALNMDSVEVPIGEPGGPLSGSSLTGAIPESIAPPDPTPEPPDPEVTTPTLTSLHPASAPIQTGDITIRILGTGFTNETVMVWNGADDHAAYNNENEMTTVVKTSLSTVPSTCTVAMRNGTSNISNELTFELVDGTPESGDEESPPAGRTFPIGPITIALVEDDADGITLTLSEAADVKAGDTVLIEATGTTAVNGSYPVLASDGTVVLVDNNAELANPIENKGRLTVTG
jgi:hypothetical protein